jgi:hypothetical protein
VYLTIAALGNKNKTGRSRHAENIIAFPARSSSASPFDALTRTLVLDQYRRGVLPEAVIEALLGASGLQP